MGAAVRSPEPTPCGCTRETLPQEPLPRPRGGGAVSGPGAHTEGLGHISTGPPTKMPGCGRLGCLLPGRAGVSSEA